MKTTCLQWQTLEKRDRMCVKFINGIEGMNVFYALGYKQLFMLLIPSMKSYHLWTPNYYNECALS